MRADDVNRSQRALPGKEDRGDGKQGREHGSEKISRCEIVVVRDAVQNSISAKIVAAASGLR